MNAFLSLENQAVPGADPILDLARDGAGNLLVATSAGVFGYDGIWTNLLDTLETTAAVVPTAVHATPDGTIFVGAAGGVLASGDQGKSWGVHGFRTPSPTVSAIATIWEEGIVLAGTLEDGVFRSDDRGATWTSWNFGLFDRTVLALGVFEDSAPAVLALTGTGCFTSANGGKSWADVSLPAGAEASAVCCVEGEVFLGTMDGQVLRETGAGCWSPFESFEGDDAVIGIQAMGSGQILAVSESGGVAMIGKDGQVVAREMAPIPGDAAVITSLGWIKERSTQLALGCSDGTLVTVRTELAGSAL